MNHQYTELEKELIAALEAIQDLRPPNRGDRIGEIIIEVLKLARREEIKK